MITLNLKPEQTFFSADKKNKHYFVALNDNGDIPSSFRLNDDDMVIVCEALKSHGNIETINLKGLDRDGKNMTDKTAFLIAGVLKANDKITEVNFGETQITDIGAKALWDVVRSKKRVVTINLDGSKITKKYFEKFDTLQASIMQIVLDNPEKLTQDAIFDAFMGLENFKHLDATRIKPFFTDIFELLARSCLKVKNGSYYA